MENVKIILDKGKIMGDVVSIAHITGRRLNVSGQDSNASDIQTPEEGADKYIVARAMSTGLAAIRERCGRYLTSGRLLDSNNLEKTEGKYELELSMPSSWNFGVTTRLTTLMHNYVVDYCIYSIFEKTNPDESISYLRKANEELMQIKSVLEMRKESIRRASKTWY